MYGELLLFVSVLQKYIYELNLTVFLRYIVRCLLRNFEEVKYKYRMWMINVYIRVHLPAVLCTKFYYLIKPVEPMATTLP